MKRPSIIDTVTAPAPAASMATAEEPGTPKPASNVVHTSIYLPRAVHRKLREIALTEDCKVHDLIMRGIDEVFQRYGHPPLAAINKKR